MKSDFETFDQKLTESVRNICHLPKNSSLNYISAPINRGGLGLLYTCEDAHLQTISHVFRLLNSDSIDIKTYANNLIRETVKKWIRTEPNAKDIEDFLNGNTTGKFHTYQSHTGNDSQSLFKKVRFSTRHFQNSTGIQFSYLSDNNLSIKFSDKGKTNIIAGQSRNAVYSILRSNFQDYCFWNLSTNYLNQGKVVQCTAVDGANNSFVKDGKYISFSGFKFIHRARLNLLPLNSTPGRDKSGKSAQCRQCGYANETLAHVLCHCKLHLSKDITARHNSILDRLVKTVQYGNKNAKISVNSVCNVANRNVRPDILVINESDKSVDIIDVTCPFENGVNAFTQARIKKQMAYEPERLAYEKLGYRVYCDAIVVGSLGSWDRYNDRVLAHLGTSHKYMYLMKKLIVRETIEHSKNIYWKHVLSKN